MKNRSLSTVAGLSGSIALMLSGQVAHAQAEDIVVESVTVQGNVVSVHLGSSAEGSAISSFLLDSPDRIAIDIMDATIAEDWKTHSIVAGDDVSDIQFTQFNDQNGKIVRVEIFTKSSMDCTCKQSTLCCNSERFISGFRFVGRHPGSGGDVGGPIGGGFDEVDSVKIEAPTPNGRLESVEETDGNSDARGG